MSAFRLKCLISHLRPASNNVRIIRCCSTQQTLSPTKTVHAIDRQNIAEISAKWPGPYRVNINSIIRDLTVEDCYAAEAKLRYRNLCDSIHSFLTSS